MPLTSNIGGTLAISIATPSTTDSSGFAALSWTIVGEVVSVSPFSDKAGNIAVDLLATGRTAQNVGVKKVDDITIKMTYSKTDAGQILLRANTNNGVTVSLRHIHSDGHIEYVFGVAADKEVDGAEAAGYKGFMTTLRPNSSIVEVSA